MPKNNSVSTYRDYRENKSPEVEVAVEYAPAEVYNITVKLQSLRDAHIQYTGQVSGKSYEWIRAGSIQAVDALDAPYLLNKRIKTQSCCSGNDVAVFQQVD